MRQDARKALNQTADLAARALHFLIADGKLALRDVTTALSRRKKLIKQLKDRFTALETEVTAAAARTRKPAPRKTSSGRPRKTASRPRKAAAQPRKAAARKAVRAKAAKPAGKVAAKKTVARSARKKAGVSKAKAAASRKPAPHTRPRTIAARTKKPAQIAVTAGTSEPTPPRPVAETESGAPAPKTTRKQPKVANPIHGGTGSGPRDTSQI